MSILISHVRSPIPEVPKTSTQGEAIPDNIRGSIMQSLAKKTDERQQTALEMKRQLNGFSEVVTQPSEIVGASGSLVDSAAKQAEEARAISGAADTLIVDGQESGTSRTKYFIWISVFLLGIGLSLLFI